MALENFIGTLFGNNIYNTPPPTNSLVYNYFLPFLIVWIIFFGILEALPIFRKTKINLLLSVAMTLMMTATPYWFILAQFMSSWGAYTAVIAFVGIFIFGVIAWAFGRGEEYVYTAGSGKDAYNPIGGKHLHNLLEKYYKLQKKLQGINDVDSPQAQAIYNEMESIKRKIEQIKAKYQLSGPSISP